MGDRLVRDRKEVKYLLAPGEGRAFLERLWETLDSPPSRVDRGWITTVYLDRPDGALAKATLERPERNVKLRLREYFTPDGLPCGPHVWIEIKERSGTVSRKRRFRISKPWVASFLRGDGNGDRPLPVEDPAADPREIRRAVEQVCRIAGGPLVAAGAARYRRLAVEYGFPRARVTLDEEVSFHLGPIDLFEGRDALDRAALGPAAVEDEGAIVELKYHGPRPPRWGSASLRGLRPTGYSKFLALSSLIQSEMQAACAHVDRF